MRRKFMMVTAAAAAALTSVPASAAIFVVQAEANSSGGSGAALDTGLALVLGQALTVEDILGKIEVVTPEDIALILEHAPKYGVDILPPSPGGTHR